MGSFAQITDVDRFSLSLLIYASSSPGDCLSLSLFRGALCVLSPMVVVDVGVVYPNWRDLPLAVECFGVGLCGPKLGEHRGDPSRMHGMVNKYCVLW